jgi:predicted negative regulator of RcsB-dependent stress response
MPPVDHGAGRWRCALSGRLGDIYSAIGNKAMAKAVWRRALAILEELHDLGAEEVRSRLGAKPGPAVPSVC